ncbi:hypothetical protein BDR26DRAFT_865721 [Obelidium mucronatum]|nr:hypothetical protein BDR26DRAFT_865721 [Obelidium mucronatum]
MEAVQSAYDTVIEFLSTHDLKNVGTNFLLNKAQDVAGFLLGPFLEVYAPVHSVLSQQVFGPISWYMIIILVLQLAINFWPNKLKDKVVARHILVKTEEKAREIQAELRLQKTLNGFKELAKKHSIDQMSARKGGLLPPFGKKEYPEEFEKYCFGFKTREWVVSPIIKTEKGFHLIMVEKKAL